MGLLDAFEPAFMQRALLAGLIAVAATSVIGTWVVIRGLAFLGDALAHGPCTNNGNRGVSRAYRFHDAPPICD